MVNLMATAGSRLYCQKVQPGDIPDIGQVQTFECSLKDAELLSLQHSRRLPLRRNNGQRPRLQHRSRKPPPDMPNSPSHSQMLLRAWSELRVMLAGGTT